jgi:hypothetical protein
VSHLFGYAVAQLIGYDVFISYSHQGGGRYAAALAQYFLQHGYYPFFDYFDQKQGRPERPRVDLWLSRALRRSKILVLVGEPIAFTRPWVNWEVETFAKGNPNWLVAISIGGAFQSNEQSGTLFPALRGRIYVTEEAESLVSGHVSPHVVEQIRRAQTSLRKVETRRRMFVLAVGAVILAFVVGVLVGRTFFP